MSNFGGDGIAPRDYVPDPKNFTFVLVTGRATVNVETRQLNYNALRRKELQVKKIDLAPGYNQEVGHRIVLKGEPGFDAQSKLKNDDLTRNDLAILTLATRAPDEVGKITIEKYAINQGEIDVENNPAFKTPTVPTANAVKVGFGRPGNGEVGSTGEPVNLKREMFNLIDAFGDGLTAFNFKMPQPPAKPDPPGAKNIRNNPPPRNTLVYDFDAPSPAEKADCLGVGTGNGCVNSSDLKNTFTNPAKPSFSVGSREGSAAGGDSGGPMFQYKDGKRFIVGVTSSGSDRLSRYGTVGYDTQVQKYKDWIVRTVGDFKNPPACPEAEPEKERGDAPLGGRIYTTLHDGTTQNIYALSTDVYLSGSPQNDENPGSELPDGTYYFQVTNHNGSSLLSTDIALCRQVLVSGGRVAGATGPPCKHANGTFDPTSSTLPVQLFPFSPTPDAGNEYKVWLIAQTADTSVSVSDPAALNFEESDAKTADFTVQQVVAPPPPPGSCQGASSLTVLVTGRNVVGYVPKGNWSVTPVNGVSVVNIEGGSILPTAISTPNVVNSCASNPLTGQTVCTANNPDVYLLTGTSLSSTLTSAGSGSIFFSGGSCTNCGVTIDAIHNKAAIGLSVAGAPGFQFLNLSTSSFETAFTSPSGRISEAPLFDPARNLLLSATESNDYEIINVATSTSPAFFENRGIAGGGELDSSAEECATAIVLAPAEFTEPSAVYIADLTQATSTAGLPAGTWTAPSQVQSLSESFLSAGASGSAVAQGTHTGIISGEFGGDAVVTAIVLPATSGRGTPAIGDWVTCGIGNGFLNGFDPHTVTAYQSPNTGDAMAVVANAGATTLAVINLTKMLDSTVVPRTVGGHGCTSGTLPSTLVRFFSVP